MKVVVTFRDCSASATTKVATAPTMVTFGKIVGEKVGARVGQNMFVGGCEGAGVGKKEGAGV